MGIMGILFNPNGRMRANQFWQGIIAIIAYMIIVNVLGGLLPAAVATILGLSFYLLPYPYLCVYGKRFHDSGKTAWLYLPLFIVFLVVGAFVVNSTPGFSDFTAQYMELAGEQDEEGLVALMNQLIEGELATAIAIRGLIYLVGINLLFGFLVARLWSDPYPNKYGEPVGGYVEPDDEDDFLT